MKLEHLRCFTHLAEVLNFTKAAEDLYITQPTLSSIIKRMEAEVGFSLFTRMRGNQKIELTPQGEVFLAQVSTALRNYDDGLRMAREIGSAAQSRISVGVIYTYQSPSWSAAMHEFCESSPYEPTINVVQSFSYGLLDMLRKGVIDVAFTGYLDGPEDLEFRPFESRPLVLEVNKKSPLAGRSSVSLDELKGLKIVSYAPASPVCSLVSALVAGHNLDIHMDYAEEITMSNLVTNSVDTAALVCNSFLLKSFDEVECIPVEDAPADFYTVYLASRKETHSPVVADFIDYMAEYGSGLGTGTLSH